MSNVASNDVGSELTHVRRQARRLLGELLACRADIEERQRTAGARDPLKTMTGRSALDVAVERTREMLVHLDEVDPAVPAVIVEPRFTGAGVSIAR